LSFFSLANTAGGGGSTTTTAGASNTTPKAALVPECGGKLPFATYVAAHVSV
jgi:hypothetical protein